MRKREKGSALILAIVILAIFAVMSVTFVFISRAQMKNYTWSKHTDMAFYNAEEGINTVINMLMNDKDYDFLADNWGNSYDFTTINTLKFQVELLDQDHNPVTASTGSTDPVPMFEPQENAIWVLSTGYCYAKGEKDYIDNTRWTDSAFLKKNVIKRTILTRLSTLVNPDMGKNAVYSCGNIDANGNMKVEGPLYSSTDIDTGSPGVSPEPPYTYDDFTVASDPDAQTECDDDFDNLDALVDYYCEKSIDDYPAGSNHHFDSGGSIGSVTGLNGIVCSEGGTLGWHANDNWDPPIDLNGDGDYDDPGDVMNVVVVRGNLNLTGTPNFKGWVIVLGEITGTTKNKLGSAAGFEGVVLAKNGLTLVGAAGLKMKWTDLGTLPSSRGMISRGVWYDASKPFNMPDGSTIIINNLPHINPDAKGWDTSDRYRNQDEQ